MKKILGTITDTFTIEATDRVLVLDRDCSAELKVGDSICVEFSDRASTTVEVLDAMIQKGKDYGSTETDIATIRVKNQGFPQQSLAGSKVHLAS